MSSETEEDTTEMEELKNCIYKQKQERVLELIKSLDKGRLNEYRVDGGDVSLLQLAATYMNEDSTVLVCLVKKCFELRSIERTGPYEGQTMLHTLVSQGNTEVAETILNVIREERDEFTLKKLLTTSANGDNFRGTVMMGELPLSIAALTLNEGMVDLLLDFEAELHARNSLGDTVFHSIIRYAHLYPEKEKQVVKMMKHLHTRLKESQPAYKSVWFISNNEGMTALKMAAAFTLSGIFNFILELEGVYSALDERDGLFDHLMYDITDIDSAATRHMYSFSKTENKVSFRKNKVINAVGVNTKTSTKSSVRKSGNISGKDKEQRTVSVLEIICENKQVDKTFDVLKNYVVRAVIKEKWQKYQKWFFAWLAFHIAFMCLLTTYAVFKSEVISNALQSAPKNTSAVISNEASQKEHQEKFVLAMSILVVLLSFVLVAWEVMRYFVRKQSLHVTLPHHNGVYRVMLLVFAASLFADSLWYWSDGPANNYFLILALLVGWWFTTIILRPFQKFSFFTVMLQKVVAGDMFRFLIIIVFNCLAFATALYVSFLPSRGHPSEEFKNSWSTLVAMFKLMFALTEPEVLNDVPEPWLTTLLFLFYQLLTYTLILNALIALMSNTCFVVSQNKECQWELQRLSLVLFIESSLPCSSFVCIPGNRKEWYRKNLANSQRILESRYAIKIPSVRKASKPTPSVRSDLLKSLAHQLCVRDEEQHQKANNHADNQVKSKAKKKKQNSRKNNKGEKDKKNQTFDSPNRFVQTLSATDDPQGRMRRAQSLGSLNQSVRTPRRQWSTGSSWTRDVAMDVYVVDGNRPHANNREAFKREISDMVKQL